MGGIVGGLGGLVGGLVNSVTGGLVNKLTESFGLDTVFQGIVNLAGDFLNVGLSTIIDSFPIPDFLKDVGKGSIGDVIRSYQQQISQEAQEAVDNDLGGPIQGFVNQIQEFVTNDVQQQAASLGGTEEGEGKDGGHWMLMLARALGKINGEQLQNMLDTQAEMTAASDLQTGANVEVKKAIKRGDEDDQISAMSDEKMHAAAFAMAQSEFQAESKIFAQTAETISTIMKTMGDAFASLSRKQ